MYASADTASIPVPTLALGTRTPRRPAPGHRPERMNESIAGVGDRYAAAAAANHEFGRLSRMADLSRFAITTKWPPRHPDRLQLYSVPSPNGVKISIMLEETGVPYEAHYINFETKEQMSEEFGSLNPYNKIPAIIDPDGPGGQPLPMFESGAILIYLAEKTGQLLPAPPVERYETLQWLMFQIGGVGPVFGQVGFFHKFAGSEFEDKRPRDHYVGAARRLLKVLDDRYASRTWIMGDTYTIADIATLPLVRNLVDYYGAGDLVGISELPHVIRALGAFVARPAVARGLVVPARSS